MLSLRTLAGKVTAYLTGLALAAFWVLAGAQRNWAVGIPDAVHTYGIRNRRGADVFFRPEIGWYIEHGFWVCLAMAAFVVVVEVVGRLLASPVAE